jgi:hypothetical protein
MITRNRDRIERADHVWHLQQGRMVTTADDLPQKGPVGVADSPESTEVT